MNRDRPFDAALAITVRWIRSVAGAVIRSSIWGRIRGGLIGPDGLFVGKRRKPALLVSGALALLLIAIIGVIMFRGGRADFGAERSDALPVTTINIEFAPGSPVSAQHPSGMPVDVSSLPAPPVESKLVAAGRFAPDSLQISQGLLVTWPLSASCQPASILTMVSPDTANRIWSPTGEIARVSASGRSASGAVYHFLQALELDPCYAEAWVNLGITLAELGRPADACSAFEKALRLNPNDRRVHFDLADTLDEMGRHAEAAEHCKAYMKLDATGPWAEHARPQIAAAS